MWFFVGTLVAALGTLTGIMTGKVINKSFGAVSTLGGLIPPGSLDPVPDETDPADPTKKKIPFLKIIAIAVLSAVGIMIVKWVGRKLNIKLLK